MFIETREDGKDLLVNIDHIQAIRINDQWKADIITSKYTFHSDETYTEIKQKVLWVNSVKVRGRKANDYKRIDRNIE